MTYGNTWERHAIGALGGIINIIARAIVELASGDLKQSQHTLGRAVKTIGDFQGRLSDEISNREEHPITSTKPDRSVSMVLRKGKANDPMARLELKAVDEYSLMCVCDHPDVMHDKLTGYCFSTDAEDTCTKFKERT